MIRNNEGVNLTYQQKHETDDIKIPEDRSNLYIEAQGNYHDLGLRQAKWSMRFSHVAAFIGLGIITVSFIVSWVWHDSDIVFPIVGAITEGIAALFYHISDRTNARMERFLDKSREDSKYYTCIKLVEKIENSEKKDEIIIEIIRSDRIKE